ncbi:TetR/AcrR family transcriptional regulator C-terminal domain-containing protein [Luteimicrobium xylanilyticum]|uniref:Tetracycline repressor protein class n=1 Tax=Luteimicrobium xylanilyticum TaxID=1133546 RepID=A0A5P9Q875_9MICO|nr:TetR family transcriptional regulator [Luteimicrobium xylanilyticum]QFU97486.1 Tetracycline repressor protein class [Luteimicrobium xylanilyticum]
MPTLTSSAVVDAARELLRAEGLQAVTFRRLQQALSVTAPSIYWRFTNKEALLGALADAVLREEFGDEPLAPEQPWGPWFREVLLRLRRAMLAYPDGARLVTGARLDHAPTLARISEAALTGALATGRDVRSSSTIVFTALHLTFGHVIEEQQPPALSAEEMAAALAPYPSIRRAVAQRDADRLDAEDAFAASLDLVLRDA